LAVEAVHLHMPGAAELPAAGRQEPGGDRGPDTATRESRALLGLPLRGPGQVELPEDLPERLRPLAPHQFGLPCRELPACEQLVGVDDTQLLGCRDPVRAAARSRKRAPLPGAVEGRTGA